MSGLDFYPTLATYKTYECVAELHEAILTVKTGGLFS